MTRWSFWRFDTIVNLMRPLMTLLLVGMLLPPMLNALTA